MNKQLSRRAWGQGALALALMPWSLSAQQAMGSALDAPRHIRWQNDPFVLGVASGQPHADSVMLWTRLWVQDADLANAAQAVTVHCEGVAGSSGARLSYSYLSSNGRLRRRHHTGRICQTLSRKRFDHDVLNAAIMMLKTSCVLPYSVSIATTITVDKLAAGLYTTCIA